jgi:hypothetical protein
MGIDVIRIRTLLESSAAQKAKEMGLEPAPFGRWKKNGVVTHRTNDRGELVPVNSDSGQSGTVNGPKPTGMSAQQAGTAPSNVPSLDDMEKRQDAARKDAMGGAAKYNKKVHQKDIGGADGENPQASPTPPQNPFRPKSFHPPTNWGKVVNSREEITTHFQDADPYQYSRELVIGETVVIAESNEQLRKITLVNDGLSDRDLDERSDAGTMSAREQNDTFRKSLPDGVFDALIKVQNWWQESPQFDRPEAQREQANNFINSVCDHYKPAIQTEFPIERGMRIHASDLEEFMSKIAIGEDIEMPPSGFSTNPRVARQFGSPIHDRVGVIMRIHPNRKGKIHGIHLTQVDVPKEKKDLREKYRQTQSEYGHEQEFIRPSGCKARCLNVTKVLSKPKDALDKQMAGAGTHCLYVIDFEEQGYEDDLQESYDKDNIKNPVFDNYMNTSVGIHRKPHDTKLKNMVNQNATA